MHARSILFTAILAVIATACSEQPAPDKGAVTPAAEGAASSHSVPGQTPRATTSQHSTGGQSHSFDAAVVAQRLCTGDCRDAGPLQARSQEEAEWLIRHQYPSQVELERLRSESLDVLQQKASVGDSAAAAVLGKRIALEKNFMAGQVMLRNQVLSRIESAKRGRWCSISPFGLHHGRPQSSDRDCEDGSQLCGAGGCRQESVFALQGIRRRPGA